VRRILAVSTGISGDRRGSSLLNRKIRETSENFFFSLNREIRENFFLYEQGGHEIRETLLSSTRRSGRPAKPSSSSRT
jgi:hypothetical protein